jgi:hypothetical protein
MTASAPLCNGYGTGVGVDWGIAFDRNGSRAKICAGNYHASRNCEKPFLAKLMSAVTAPPLPKIRLSIGVTGHRADHPQYAENKKRIISAMAAIFDAIDLTTASAPLLLGPGSLAPIRLHTLLVDGTDQAASKLALERKWQLVSPLPFGQRLNLAINAVPDNAGDARALLAGQDPKSPGTKSRVDAIQTIARQARLFELADQDDVVAALYLAHLDAKEDFSKAQSFALEGAQRAALAGRILIEQSDFIIAVWDGKSSTNLGGTGHTVASALDLGAPVIWINPADPENWRILHAPESLALLMNEAEQQNREIELSAIIKTHICPEEAIATDDNPARRGIAALTGERWHDRSSRLVHAYRRIVALFGGEKPRFGSLVQYYEKPGDIAEGSGAGLLQTANDLPGADRRLADRIDHIALQNFAWADGVSARLSDHYRAGMIVNFLLSALAIVGGIIYLPLVSPDQKWGFALFEFILLLAIVIITYRGQKYRWHGRWFETRRVAEYFRHSPLLLMLGVARAPGRWPRGTETSWPEWYVRSALRDIGLPCAKVTSSYLRSTLTALLDHHVTPQCDYHARKAKRLNAVHHNLDRFSEFLFKLAILSVATYLLLKGGSALFQVNADLVAKLSKTFTVLGVLFPTFGAAIAGIRYFGDFERFAAISEITAEKLKAICERVELLLSAPETAMDYRRVTELIHAADDVVVAEIENWQAVFGGKHITVPV